MRTARAAGEVVLAPPDALALWCDVTRWATFVEGFAQVLEHDPDWPAEGTRVVWQSVAAGRGRVTEKVIEAGSDRVATMVFEDRLAGRQAFQVEPAEPGARVELSLEYTLTKYGPFGAVADAIFIRRAIRDSLRRTLFRFSVEAEEEAGLR